MVETRSAKRQRLADLIRLDAAGEPIEDVGNASVSHGASYFRTLSVDALADVFRHLSTRPLHCRWSAFVSPWDVALVCGEGHPLQYAVRANMTSMHAHYWHQLPRELEASGVQLERGYEDSTFNDLLTAHAVRLRVLSMDAFGFPVNSGAPFAHCRCLRVLFLGFNHHRLDVVPLLRACGHGLRELHLTGEDHLPQWHVNAIAQWCTALTTLSLEHLSTDTSLEPLWRAVGESLTHIAVSPPRPKFDLNFAAELTSIATHCSSLVDLEVVHCEICFELIPLLESLGT